MKKYKVIQNGIETNSWLETFADETHYEPCFGLPDRWLPESALSQEEIAAALDVRDSIEGKEYFFAKTYQVQMEDLGNSLDLAKLRGERNALLAACDWTQMSDSPLSSGKKTAWATYRQALRDMPETASDVANPTWPTKP